MSNKSGVVYIQKEKFDIYSPSLGRVFEFRYVPEIIKDMEVINRVLLEDIIKLFIERSQISADNLLFVIGDNACFIKDFMPDAQTTATPQEQAKEFIDHVPFESVSSKTFAVQGGVRVFATNKDLYRSFKLAFEKLGFKVESVIPGFLIGNNMSLQPSLIPQMAAYALLKLNDLRQYNLLTEEKTFEEVKATENEEKTNGNGSGDSGVEINEKKASTKNKKRLFLLVGIFVVLIIIAVALFFMQG